MVDIFTTYIFLSDSDGTTADLQRRLGVVALG